MPTKDPPTDDEQCTNEQSYKESETRDEGAKGVPTARFTAINRRDWLKVAGAATLGGFGLGGVSGQSMEGGPPNPDEWTLSFEDRFEGSGLDTSNWGIGFGWGTQTNYSPSEMVAENVEVENGVLKLHATDASDGYHVGGVNSKNNVTFGPGSYLEAKVRVMDLPGSTNAFWSKPNSEAWPPEIDFMEVPTGRIYESMHNIHYSTSGEVGDGSTHTKATNGKYNPDGERMSDRFFVYGCEWFEDSIAHYVDGNLVGRTTDADVTDAVAAGAPFYMMLNNLVGGWPPGDVPDDWSGYRTTMEVDWVRVWEYGGSSSGSGSTDDGSDGTTDSGEHYAWFRSGDGNEVSFAFTASGGNVRLADTDTDADYWVSDDGQTAGGTTTRTGSLPGFRFDGEIDGFEYTGDLDVFVDNEPVDAATLAAETPPPERFLWARSADGSEVEFAFAASNGNVRLSDADTDADYWVSDDGQTAGGTTTRTGSLPGFWFQGLVSDLAYEGPLELYVADQQVDPATFVDESTPGPGNVGQLPRTVAIDGSGYDGSATYTVTVSDAIEPTDSVTAEDSIAGRTATGSVGDGRDAYTFAGSITDLAVEGEADVSVDGTTRTLLTVERGPDSSGTVVYLVEATGALTSADIAGTTDDAEIGDTTALGEVADGTDAYWVSEGAVADVSAFRGDVVTRVNDQQVELGD